MLYFIPNSLPRLMVAPNGARPMKKDHPAVPVTISETVETAKEILYKYKPSTYVVTLYKLFFVRYEIKQRKATQLYENEGHHRCCGVTHFVEVVTHFVDSVTHFVVSDQQNGNVYFQNVIRRPEC